MNDPNLLLVGNPAHRRLIREWERREGGDWPRDPVTGRKHDVAHIRAKADGGTDTLDNIRPMPRDLHHAEHVANGDYLRWGARPGIARAFGGTVARGLNVFSFLPDIAAIASGQVRTDTPEHFFYDLAGEPTPEERLWRLQHDGA